MKSKITQKRLKEVLDYNKETGIFVWIKPTNRSVIIGSIAGCKNKYGYTQIRIDGNGYRANRLAWLYEKGYFPEHGLDHKDRVKHHDWISNLRETSNQCNQRNTDNPKDNTSGVKGVGFIKRDNKWKATIKINNKTKCLGTYKDFNNAVCARLAGEQACKWEGCDNSSPAYKYVKQMLSKH